MNINRRFIRITLTVLIVAIRSTLFAAELDGAPRFEGSWKWTFTMPDGNQATPRLKLKRADDKLTGVTSFREGSEAPITNLVVKGDELSFAVVRERDGREIITQYAGKLSGDAIKGKILSNWNGENHSYDWEARRVAGPEGTWKWNGGFGGFRSQSTVKLKQEGEKVSGKIVGGRGGDTDIHRGKFKNGEISFEVERDRDGEKIITRYYGILSGDKIQGQIESNFGGSPRTNNWEAVRLE